MQSLQIHLHPVVPQLQFCPSWSALLMEDPTGYFQFLLIYSATVVGLMQRELEVMQAQMAVSSDSLRIAKRHWESYRCRAI